MYIWLGERNAEINERQDLLEALTQLIPQSSLQKISLISWVNITAHNADIYQEKWSSCGPLEGTGTFGSG
jgi:predicted XRE-type DNA-binding protein